MEKRYEMVTLKQIKKIWVEAKRLEMPEERYRELIEEVSGQRSTRELTKAQAKQVIDILVGKGEKKVRRPRGITKYENVFLISSPEQLAYIRDLQKKAGWDDERLNKFIQRQWGKCSLEILEHGEAGVVIHVLLKEIKKREAA